MNEELFKALDIESLRIIKANISKIIFEKKKQRRATNAKNFLDRQTLKHADLSEQKGLLAMKKAFRQLHANEKRKYLKLILKQDWKHLFSGETLCNEKKYYVYAHIDPRKSSFLNYSELGGSMIGMPFYIGKGCGARAYDLKRNAGHGLRIKSILNEKYSQKELVFIFQSGLTELDSFELEAKLIYFFGTIYEEGVNGILLNLDKAKRPNWTGYLQKIKKVEAK